MNRLQVDGKFFLLGGERVFLRSVTYGPFPDPQPDLREDFRRMAELGFHAVRLYESPSVALLEAAEEFGLLVFVGLHWQYQRSFLGDGGETHWHEARLLFLDELKKWGNHPAVAGVYVANEIAPDVARWMGIARVSEALDQLIADLRLAHPHLLYAYSSYPSSEYLEPSLADFTAINVYLEDKKKLEDYLAHLHHVGGDRPVMISEFGLDSMRNGEERQAEILGWQIYTMRNAGIAGATIFAWSDLWRKGSDSVEDWSFGLVNREGEAKLALQAVAKAASGGLPPLSRYPMISVIICVHNGAERVKPCLDFIHQLAYPCYEVIVVDDGSKDGLNELLECYPEIRYIRQEHAGLSAARNLGAKHAQGDIFAYTDDDCVPDRDWLYWLAKGYEELGCDLCGGPNLAPEPLDEDEAVVAAAPGAPTHVMFGDKEAEHLPGCNLSVTREAFALIGGFNERYWVAGDDVDFCWRAEALGLKLGFHGACFVWHRRRTSYFRYFKQQRGYGKAEAMLMDDHPQRFNELGSARWGGVVYLGGAMSAQSKDTIYSGPMGEAPYQHLVSSVMPMRPLHRDFTSGSARRKLSVAKWFNPILRAFSRVYYSQMKHRWWKYMRLARVHLLSWSKEEGIHYTLKEYSITTADYNLKQSKKESLLVEGWSVLENDADWDLAHPDGRRLLLCLETIGRDAWCLKMREGHPSG